MEKERTLPVPELEIVRIADGLGYGEGTISGVREDVDAETKARAEAAINSPEILVAVDTDKEGNMIDDDGCGDGRGVRSIIEGTIERFKSLNRPKVFGGGPAMAAASIIGLGKAKGKKLFDVFKSGVTALKDSLIDFGGHTDERAHGPDCGCGAIDKAPVAVANAVKFESSIRGAIDLLGVDKTGLDDVYSEFHAYASEIADDESYKGVEVMDEITGSGKVVKKLADSHNEMYIVLNMKRGFTVNQELVRQATDGLVQVFGVDVWRMLDLSTRLYPNATPEEQNKAFLSELIYTLAVAGTLTKGDLPVYLVSELQPVAA